MSRALTSATTLDQLKGEAKLWLKALRTGDPEARARLLRAHPGAPPDAGLRHVQHALAREFGFASWARLKAALAAAASPPADPRDEAIRALLAAADAGDADAVARVLDARPDVLNVRGTLRGHTGLRTALHFGVQHEPVVRLLLERGADPNIRDEGDDAFPLHFAAERQDLPVIRLLVEHGADTVGDGTHHELNVLGWATAWDYLTADPAVVAYLLAHGARHTIASAVALGDVGAIRAVVAQAPAERDRAMDRTNRRRRPLHLAIVKAQLAALETLLDLGADTEAADLAGLTPLDQAALAGATAFVDRLIARGAAIRLPAAVALGRPADVVRLVADEPGSLVPGGRWGSLIVRAAERAPAAVIEALVRHGASVDATDDPATAVDGIGGYTALHAAAWHGNTAAADALLRLGANPRRRDARYNATPAGWADYAGKPETRDRIVEADIDVFDAIACGTPARVTAILDADPAALERPLGEYGGTADDATVTPMAWAIEQGKADMVALLEARGARPPRP
jgi:ankyrin repeat protein